MAEEQKMQNMDSKSFSEAYGKVVNLASSLVNFVVEKKYLGEDDKFEMKDLGVIVQELIPVLSNIDNIQTLVQNADKFLDKSYMADLDKAFKENFDLKNANTEETVEDAHGVVLSTIRLVVRYTQ